MPWARAFWQPSTSVHSHVQPPVHASSNGTRRAMRPRLGGPDPSQAQRGTREAADTRSSATIARSVTHHRGVSFIRRVQPDGRITVLSEAWRVGRASRAICVATITTHRIVSRLYQRSAQADWALIRACLPYQNVKRRKPDFFRPQVVETVHILGPF